jgi:hypothetical protein
VAGATTCYCDPEARLGVAVSMALSRTTMRANSTRAKGRASESEGKTSDPRRCQDLYCSYDASAKTVSHTLDHQTLP